MPAVAMLKGWAALRALSDRRFGPTRAIQLAHARHGPIVVVQGKGKKGEAGRKLVLVADLKVARAVLQNASTFCNLPLYAARGPEHCAHRRLRDGMLGMNGEIHRHFRSILAPVLTQGSMDHAETRMRDIARSEVAAWQAGDNVDLMELAKRLSQRLSLELIFGEPDLERGLLVGAEIAAHMALCASAEGPKIRFEWPGASRRRLIEQAERTEAVLISWVKERRGATRGSDMMSAVLEAVNPAGDPLSDSEAAAQLWTLYAASFDTTAAALGWLVLLLAQHPVHARRLLRAYEDEDPGQTAPPLVASDIIREAMRLCPVVPFQTRRVTEPVVLPGCDLQLGPGDRVVISSCVINRSGQAFLSPEEFWPERWMDESLSKSALLSFGLGPRACPGARFATAALSAALREVWLNWRINIEEGARIGCYTMITHFPKRARISLRRQDGAFQATQVSGRACAITPALEARPAAH
ncbi:MAG: hypothetical protein JWM33_3439 [Caulobacteraceae bacterium]|nr:hypothetical protein [Caulobacteraceae bacterium]